MSVWACYTPLKTIVSCKLHWITISIIYCCILIWFSLLFIQCTTVYIKIRWRTDGDLLWQWFDKQMEELVLTTVSLDGLLHFDLFGIYDLWVTDHIQLQMFPIYYYSFLLSGSSKKNKKETKLCTSVVYTFYNDIQH